MFPSSNIYSKYFHSFSYTFFFFFIPDIDFFPCILTENHHFSFFFSSTYKSVALIHYTLITFSVTFLYSLVPYIHVSFYSHRVRLLSLFVIESCEDSFLPHLFFSFALFFLSWHIIPLTYTYPSGISFFHIFYPISSAHTPGKQAYYMKLIYIFPKVVLIIFFSPATCQMLVSFLLFGLFIPVFFHFCFNSKMKKKVFSVSIVLLSMFSPRFFFLFLSLKKNYSFLHFIIFFSSIFLFPLSSCYFSPLFLNLFVLTHAKSSSMQMFPVSSFFFRSPFFSIALYFNSQFYNSSLFHSLFCTSSLFPFLSFF